MGIEKNKGVLHLSICFNGTCREAVAYYAKLFELEPPKFMTYGEMDTSFDPNVQMSESGKEKISHAELNIGGVNIAFCDMPDNFEFVQGNNVMLGIKSQGIEEANSVIQALGEGGSIDVPLIKIPSGGYYGMATDRFGITWKILAS